MDQANLIEELNSYKKGLKKLEETKELLSNQYARFCYVKFEVTKHPKHHGTINLDQSLNPYLPDGFGPNVIKGAIIGVMDSKIRLYEKKIKELSKQLYESLKD